MTDNARIVELIRNLMAKASGTENEHEAALFAAKVQELLARHNLDASAIGAHPSEAPHGRSRARAPFFDPWIRRIMQDCGRLYFCTIYIDRHKYDRPDMVFCGRDHNVEIATSMSRYLIDTVLRLSRAYGRENQSEQRTARFLQRDFARGCGMRLAERLREMYVEQTTRAKAPAVASGLPALYRTELELADAFMRTSIWLRKTRKASVSYGDAGHDGAAAANGISLSAQVAGAGSARLLA